MNFTGLPDNHKPSTRGRAPDIESNNIFGGYPEAPTDHYQRQKKNNDAKASAQTRQMYEDKCNETFASRNKQNQHSSNIFGETTAQDFQRDSSYASQRQQQTMNYQAEPMSAFQNGQNGQNGQYGQHGQNRNESTVFNEQRLASAPRTKQQNQRKGYNPITGS